MKLMFNGEEVTGGVSMEQVNAAIDEKITNIKAEEVYSTEETRIGTWIDGKPLYRKVFVKTYDSANRIIGNIGKSGVMVSLSGYIMNRGIYQYPIPYLNIYQGKNEAIGGFCYQGNVYFDSSFSAHTSNDIIYAIVCYTKTTD